MDKFLILGERCSGSNFLEACVLKNFNVQHKQLCHKHFFLHMKPQDFKETRVIMIIRNQNDWLQSFFHTPHHVPKKNSKSWKSFLTNSWTSIINKKEMDVYKNKSFLNIFEMRSLKLRYMMILKKKLHPNQVVIIHYEHLKTNINKELQKIVSKFHWKPKNSIMQSIDYDVKELKHKNHLIKYKTNKYPDIPSNIITVIKKNTNWKLENYIAKLE